MERKKRMKNFVTCNFFFTGCSKIYEVCLELLTLENHPFTSLLGKTIMIYSREVLFLCKHSLVRQVQLQTNNKLLFFLHCAIICATIMKLKRKKQANIWAILSTPSLTALRRIKKVICRCCSSSSAGDFLT